MSEMTEERLIKILERLEAGDSSAEIVADNPADSQAISGTLEIVENLSKLASRPYVSAHQASRQAFLAQAADLHKARSASQTVAGDWRHLFRRLIFVAMGLILFLFGASILAGEALPGDFLYGPKSPWKMPVWR